VNSLNQIGVFLPARIIVASNAAESGLPGYRPIAP
jgi:hypothetical protein